LRDSVPFDAKEAMERLGAAGSVHGPFFWPMNEQPGSSRMGLFGTFSALYLRTSQGAAFTFPAASRCPSRRSIGGGDRVARSFDECNLCEYAAYYDLLYKDKDYAGRMPLVRALLTEHARDQRSPYWSWQRTGAHASLLSEMGFDVLGVDISDCMLRRQCPRGSNRPAGR